MNIAQFLLSLGMNPPPLSEDDDESGLTAPNVITPPRTVGTRTTPADHHAIVKRGGTE